MLRITSKVLLSIMTLILWAAAAGLIFIGSWVFIENKHYDQLVTAYYTLIPATIIIAVGIAFFILGLIGCVGAFKEHRCLLSVFFTVVLFILMAMVVAASLGYVYRTDIDRAVKKGIQKGMAQYDTVNNTHMTEGIDFMQKELSCCGLNNYTDWEATPWYKHNRTLNVPYPDSCCPHSNCTAQAHAYNRGCYEMLRDEFLGHLGIVAGVAGGFAIFLVSAIFLIFGMISACALMCHRRSTNTYIGLTSPEHMRV